MEKEEEKSAPREAAAQEVAEAEFERFCKSMDIRCDVSKMDTETVEDFEKLRDTLVCSITRGNLVINETGEPVFTPVSDDGEPIIFHEGDGSDKMAMDNLKEGKNMTKFYALMASVTRNNRGRFGKMKERDLKICEATLRLFMG
jgi:hypothetical protein